jgi:signal transduction histidine kinase/ActR/RegA family two-component response regulator
VSSILVGDEFWGLVVGHERSGPHVPTLVERNAFQLASTLTGGILSAQQVASTMALNRIIELAIDRISDRLATEGPAKSIAMEYPALAEAFGLDAMVVQLEGATMSQGLETPPLAPMDDPGGCLISDHFIDRFDAAPDPQPELARHVVGGCILRIGNDPTSLLLLGRSQHDYVVQWGGEPKTAVVATADTEGGAPSNDPGQRAASLRPRTSFAAWKQIVKGRSQPFCSTEQAALKRFGERLTVIIQADGDRRRHDRASFEERMAAIGRLAGGVAHDLNNFLAVIGINLDLALECSDDTELQDLLQVSLRAVQNSAEVTSALLTFARRQRLAPTAVEVRSFLSKFQSMAQPLMGQQVRLVCDIGDAALRCRADAGLLETAMLNLATNARDSIHTIAGEIRISANALHAAHPVIGLGGEIPQGDYVIFCVSDSGDGMPADVLAHAAEPFFTTKGAGQGTGLGLSMVLGFAAQSGGTVTIDSTPGSGTKVCIILPRIVEDAMVEAPKPSIKAQSLLQGTRLLVVEDNESLAHALRAMVLREGILVSLAASVPEARVLLETADFDVMLCDFMLGTTGTAVDVMAICRALKHDLPTIVMTGYADASTDQLEGLAPYRLLRKPFTRQELVAALLVERRQRA